MTPVDQEPSVLVSCRMRYTRTWVREDGTWRVIAAPISPAAGER